MGTPTESREDAGSSQSCLDNSVHTETLTSIFWYYFFMNDELYVMSFHLNQFNNSFNDEVTVQFVSLMKTRCISLR